MPFSRDLSDPGIELQSLMSPALAGRFFITSATWVMMAKRKRGEIWEGTTGKFFKCCYVYNILTFILYQKYLMFVPMYIPNSFVQVSNCFTCQVGQKSSFRFFCKMFQKDPNDFLAKPIFTAFDIHQAPKYCICFLDYGIFCTFLFCKNCFC